MVGVQAEIGSSSWIGRHGQDSSFRTGKIDNGSLPISNTRPAVRDKSAMRRLLLAERTSRSTSEVARVFLGMERACPSRLAGRSLGGLETHDPLYRILARNVQW